MGSRSNDTCTSLIDIVTNLFDETIRQRSSKGIAFPRLLDERGAVPGIKVDMGTKPLARAPGESVTEGPTVFASAWSSIGSSARVHEVAYGPTGDPGPGRRNLAR